MKINKILFFIFVLLFNTSIYPQYEVGFQYNISQFLQNRFINSLNSTYFYYYQFNTIHTIIKNNSKYVYDYEFYFIIDHFMNDNIFLRPGIGNYQFLNINSIYLTNNNQYKLKWNGNFNNIFFDIGNKYFFKKKWGFEYFLGLGYIYRFKLFYKKWETDQSPFKEPFEYSSGNFSTYEGLLFRSGWNILIKQKNYNLRLGILYQYTITDLLTPKEKNRNLYWINQNKIWITEDISRYIINKEQYEQENKTIINLFPEIENVKVYFSNIKIFISLGFRF